MPLNSSVLAAHRHRIYDFSLRFLRCREDAADVTQEVLVRFWQRGEHVEAQARLGWVMRVTRNACLDHIRRKKTRNGYTSATEFIEDFEGDEPSPERLSESADFRTRLEDAIAQLDEPYQSLIILRELHELTYDELAVSLDLPPASVKVYLHRARRRLRSALQQILTAEELTP